MKRTILGLACSAVLLSACGGGDSDLPGGSSGGIQMLVLSAANAEAAARVSWGSAQTSAGLADTGLDLDSFGVSTAPGKQQTANAAAGISVNVSQIAIGPEITVCDGGGTITMNADLASLTTLTPDDTISIDADNCNDGLGTTLDGLIEMTVTSFEGDIFGLYAVGTDTIITALTATSPEDTVSMDGDSSVLLDSLASPFVTADVSGDEVTTSNNAGTATLTAYSSHTSVDGGAEGTPYTMQAGGTLDSSELSGVVSYTTPVPFEGSGTEYPHKGELLISGENSSVRLIAVDNVNVTIEIDNNGDNTVDETIDTTWDALLSGAT